MQTQKPRQGYKIVKLNFGRYEEIPEDWKIEYFNDLIKFVGGTQPPRNTFVTVPRKGYIRLLQIRDFENDDHACYVKENNKLSICTKVDILIARYGASLGRILRGKSGAHNVALVRTVPDVSKINPNYLYFWLNSTHFQKHVQKIGDRVAQAGFNKDDFNLLKILLPSLPEQQKIASILSNVDSLIQQTQNEIEQAQRLKKSLTQRLLTKGIGHTKFKKVKWLFGKEIEIPEEWRVTKLSEIAKIRYGLSQPPSLDEKGIPMIRATDIKRGRIIKDKPIRIAKTSIPLSKSPFLYEGDIIVVRSGVFTGDVGLVTEEYDGSVIGYDLVITPNKEVDPKYLLEYFLSPFVQNYFISLSSRSAQPHLNSEQVGSTSLLLANPDEQKMIASILFNVDSAINKLESKGSLLETLKKGLMQKLLTGQIRPQV